MTSAKEKSFQSLGVAALTQAFFFFLLVIAFMLMSHFRVGKTQSAAIILFFSAPFAPVVYYMFLSDKWGLSYIDDKPCGSCGGMVHFDQQAFPHCAEPSWPTVREWATGDYIIPVLFAGYFICLFFFGFLVATVC